MTADLIARAEALQRKYQALHDQGVPDADPANDARLIGHWMDVGDRAMSLLTELLASRSEGWQDISTAPKDGTKILLSDGKRIGIGYWLKDYASGHPCRDWFSDMLSAGFPHNPTHWMSLPALPKENA